MNLLVDSWVPVRRDGHFRQVTLQDVLCGEEDWMLALPRDDLELAALQLLICLTQVVFLPDNAKALHELRRKPLSLERYQEAISAFGHADWFDLTHFSTPFMQTPGVQANEVTSMQKLFIGLPEGNNHAWFNAVDEILTACAPCSAIALFNQACNCPSFGGGFKGALRGGAPVTTLISGGTLRKTIWSNVVTKKFVQSRMESGPEDDVHVWVDRIERDMTILPQQVGLLRGLFWQPAHVELIWQKTEGICDLCGISANPLATGFKKEKFTYAMPESPKWPHPHGPHFWEIKDGKRSEKFLSFTKTAPAWTDLTGMLIRREDDKKGHAPAAVVSQFESLQPAEAIHLIVGGYRNKQASVLERRHELFSLPAGWDEGMESLEGILHDALEIKDILRKKGFAFGKAIGVKGVAGEVESRYFQDSEATIHATFRSLDWQQAMATHEAVVVELIQLAKRIFDEVTEPYKHDPKMLRALLNCRRRLFSDLNKMRSPGWKNEQEATSPISSP